MEKTFLLFVTYKAKPDCAELFVRELEQSGVADKVRAEDGCIRYDYYFSSKDKDEVLLFEEWESEEKQQIHVTQPHMAPIMEAKDKYILSVELRAVK